MINNLQEKHLYLRRKAPKKLEVLCPELWSRVMVQRFAWLRIRWLFLLSLLLIYSFFPLVVLFIVAWLSQRKNPSLMFCTITEIIIMLYLGFLLITSGAYVGLFIIGPFFLFYQASARSWHYLFLYMKGTSTEFSVLCDQNDWFGYREPRIIKRHMSTAIACLGAVISCVAFVSYMNI